MTGMRKSVGEPAIPSISTAPSVQAVEEDRIQEVATTFEASSKDVVNPSIGPAKVQPQPVVNPPRFEKEIRCPEIPTSNPMDVQERIHPDWMNTPASSSHPSPGGHLDHASTPTSRISLNEVRSLSQNRVDAKTLEEMRNKMEAAIAEAQQYKD
ncbi:hypothetical protein Nepgr_002971 [Nepenthes gracilis]|uniref:Uncharacterized protein n=1 Tax=Nepenthes gracilis TaxID=150966 RepID=A0AAD3RYP1_NEPGR|nr:hypothetical protein Nepgr_002971 [Nepenthes gracilis]